MLCCVGVPDCLFLCVEVVRPCAGATVLAIVCVLAVLLSLLALSIFCVVFIHTYCLLRVSSRNGWLC